MRILVVASARSGSTSTSWALSKYYNISFINEPYHPAYINLRTDEYIKNIASNFPEECVVKVMSIHMDKEWYLTKLFPLFDKIIFLTRDNTQLAYESFVYKQVIHWEKSGGPSKWQEPYQFDASSHTVNEKWYNHMVISTGLVREIASELKQEVILYENLFNDNEEIFKKEIEKFNLPELNYKKIKPYLDTKFKQRKPLTGKTII